MRTRESQALVTWVTVRLQDHIRPASGMSSHSSDCGFLPQRAPFILNYWKRNSEFMLPHCPDAFWHVRGIQKPNDNEDKNAR